jgi:uncharacterized protein (TIGR02246 family)
MPNHQIIASFFEALNARDLEAMDAVLLPDARFDFPKTQPLDGKDRILKFFSILFRQYPKLTFEVQRVIVQADRAAVHWTNKGENRRKEPYDNEGVTILEFEGDKICYISDFFKNTEKF